MFKAIGVDFDGRINAWCVTAQCSYAWFLEAVSGSEANFEIQRAVIKGRKAYATLREDLRKGCVLPPIVLAEAGGGISPLEGENVKSLDSLSSELKMLRGDAVYIIDGLQRTNAIRQTMAELDGSDREQFLSRQLRVECWLGASFGAIAYRMLLLNAGQRPMSMKHQIEVLSSRLGHELSNIPGVEIFTVGDARRRFRPGQFQLAKLSMAFQAWLQGQPNVDVRNVVMEELLAEGAVETLGSSVGSNGSGPGFKKIFEWVVEMDRALGGDYLHFFGNETVLQGFCAAVGSSERHPKIADRVWPALESLREEARRTSAQDVLGVEVFTSLRTGFDVSKINVGSATRELVFGAFQEQFFSGGLRSMVECWEIAASRI
ncbi:hypothetical protein EAT51_05765 [Pseudoxanthomonas winnipegensis]|uniref:hypothetical protein n=1 Tax=Pseudoxanthomonas winnipegensis TaxID=2480810 RepID=UPI00102DABB9|nr:hypothetical protein [Pseudoxanthomonas winnipegensis]TAA43179.1 hypothetical protein EAT51_05765 [Pseudoxanthomonas winnipegensis]